MAAKTAPKSLIVRLKPDAFDALSEFCDVTGVSRQSVIADMVYELLPHLSELVKVHAMVKRGSAPKALRRLSERLSQVSADLLQEAGEAQFQLGLKVGGGPAAGRSPPPQVSEAVMRPPYLIHRNKSSGPLGVWGRTEGVVRGPP